MPDHGLDTEETKMKHKHSLPLRISFLAERRSRKLKNNMEWYVLWEMGAKGAVGEGGGPSSCLEAKCGGGGKVSRER